MERHIVYLAVFAIVLSAVFAQQPVNDQITDSVTDSVLQSPFDSYCYNKCIAITGDSRCESVCLSNTDEFGSFCNEVCIEKSGNANLCTVGCTLLTKKRTEMKACFDPCAGTKTDEACDNQCNITSSVRALALAAGLASSGEMTEGKLDVIERHISNVFPNSTVAIALGREILVNEGNINFSDVGGRKYIRLPLGLATGEKLDSFEDRQNNISIINDSIHIPLRSKAGRQVANIVAETNGIRGKDGIAEGEITSIKLKTEAVKAVFADTMNQTFKEPEVSIDADLNNIPDSAALDIRSADVSSTTLERFKTVAKGMNLTIKERAFAVEVVKENLQNKADVARAKIRMKVDKAWVDSIGGIGAIRIKREDEGSYEMLGTSSAGEQGGMLIVEGDSPNGLSLYAMVTVGVTTPAGDTGRITVSPGSSSGGINPVLIGAILLIVVAAVYFFVLKKK